MPVYILGKEPVFPPVEMATKEGIIAIGGDLSIERLLNAYSNGIFPWYSNGEPIIWWSPDPRLVLYLKELHISKSMKRLLNKDSFKITINQNFKYIIKNCQKTRKSSDQTWITEEMLEAYTRLHKAGYAHSVEVLLNNKIVGGFYGVSLGKCFFGESMYYEVNNASKFGFIIFVQKLQELGFLMIDCQINTKHLKNLGAREIPRTEFLQTLKKCLKSKPIKLNLVMK